MPRQKWQFITTTNGKIDDETTQKIVRGNAMRDYRRNQRIARREEFESMRAKNSTSQNREEARSEGQGETEEEHNVRVANRGAIGAMRLYEPGNRVDPFGSTELPVRVEEQELFSHFLRELLPRLQSAGNASTRQSISHLYGRTALTSRGSILTILYNASLHRDRYRGYESPITMYYHGQAVRDLNKRLDVSEDAISDDSIGMVGFLAQGGNLEKHAVEDITHTKALRTMIAMRGGLQTLGCQGVLAVIIMIGDFVGATIANTSPRLDPPPISSNPLLNRLPAGLLNIPPTTQDPNSFVPAIQACMRAMSALVNLQSNVLHENSGDMNTAINLNQLFSSVEYQLISIKPPSVSPKNTHILLHEASRLVLLTNLSYTQRDFPNCSTVLVTLHKRLAGTLTALEPLGQFNNVYQRKLMFWVLLVGGISSYQSEWYADRIARLLVKWNVGGWEDVVTFCKEFVWSERIAREVGYTLAGEVRSRLWPLVVTNEGQRILGSGR